MIKTRNYKELVETKEGIYLYGITHFHPQHIFECGQCFRWSRVDPENPLLYEGVVHGKVLQVSLEDDTVFITNLSEKEFLEDFYGYFDFHRDYGVIKEELKKDPVLEEAVDFGYGIRVLNQDPFEILISFILSSNNLIPKIKEGIRRISQEYGDKILDHGKAYYAFPTPEQLSVATEEDFRNLGVGYRAKYIYASTKMVVESLAKEGNSTPSLYELKDLSAGLCHKALLAYAGVGPKVADCVMLFSMDQSEAFPVDVWVKKAMAHFYGSKEKNLLKTRAFGQKLFGVYAGFAQQYLFYYAREKKIVLT